MERVPANRSDRSREHADVRIAYGSFLLLAAMAVLLTNCMRNPSASIRDVDYFKSHPRERINELARCEQDPGRAKNHPDCVNAGKAQWDELTKADDSAAQPPAPDQ